MDSDFWLQRWDRNEIGFHQPDTNRLLIAHWPRLSVAPGERVLVPLCGKSLDMLWLRARRHDVVGVELSALAAQAFDRENALGMRTEPSGPFLAYRGEGLTLLVGDFFQLTPGALGDVRGVYDRAALVALPPELRRRYVEHLRALLPAGARILLLTFEYDQREMNGPPFSVDEVEVRRLYGNGFDIEPLSRDDILAQEPKFREHGLTRLSESAYHLVRR